MFNIDARVLTFFISIYVMIVHKINIANTLYGHGGLLIFVGIRNFGDMRIIFDAIHKTIDGRVVCSVERTLKECLNGELQVIRRNH